MLFQINPSFTKKNQLKLNLSKNLVNKNYKLCFSLVYSIQSIDGAEIINQTGRYYELIIKKNTVLIDLQIPRIGSYNMSCGPEGAFIIDDKNNHIKVKVSDLEFENQIEEVKYDQSTTDIFTPIGRVHRERGAPHGRAGDGGGDLQCERHQEPECEDHR